MLESATLTISEDEPAFGLAEVNRNAPDSRGFHRYQVIQVVRRDRLVLWQRDMGLVADIEKTTVDSRQINLIGGQTFPDGRLEAYETVGTLLDMADALRAGYSKFADVPDVISEDWASLYHDEADRRRLKKAGRMYSIGRN